MPNEHNLQLVAPFSPTILRATMPPAAVEALNAHADAILASQDEAAARDWSRHLAGVVSHETRVTDLIEQMPVFSDFLYDVARTFTYRCENALIHFADYDSTDELRDTKLRIQVKEGWINDMVAGTITRSISIRVATSAASAFLRCRPVSMPNSQPTRPRRIPPAASSSSTAAARSASRTSSR